MEGFLLDWANLLLRWLHVIVAIAWIGSSFYFVWLDNHLRAPTDPALKNKGVGGELWAVHGGGFYNPQKYLGAPPKLPGELHWFYWESYSTWMSGFALFTVVYLANPRAFLIDPNVAALTPTAAVVLALAFLVVGWFVYDLLCRMLEKKEGLLACLVVAFVTIASWAACNLFAGRAAFLIVGAMIATIMSANVFFWIIPGQRKTVAAMEAGIPVDPIHGQRGKQRSVHNPYFTLPVLFSMLSNHYSMTYSHQYNWVILVVIMVSGVLIRQFFILRHKGVMNPVYPSAAVALLGAVLAVTMPEKADPNVAQAASEPVSIAKVQQVMNDRCIQCHAAQTTMMPTAAKGILLDNAESVKTNAQLIYQQVVLQKAMPLGNSTQMTEAERALIKNWFESGAH